MGTNHNMNRSATIMLSMAVLCLLAGTSMAHYTAARHPPYSARFGFDHPFYEDEPDIFYREVSDDLADQVTSLKEQLGQSRATAMQLEHRQQSAANEMAMLKGTIATLQRHVQARDQQLQHIRMQMAQPHPERKCGTPVPEPGNPPHPQQPPQPRTTPRCNRHRQNQKEASGSSSSDGFRFLDYVLIVAAPMLMSFSFLAMLSIFFVASSAGGQQCISRARCGLRCCLCIIGSKTCRIFSSVRSFMRSVFGHPFWGFFFMSIVGVTCCVAKVMALVTTVSFVFGLFSSLSFCCPCLLLPLVMIATSIFTCCGGSRRGGMCRPCAPPTIVVTRTAASASQPPQPPQPPQPRQPPRQPASTTGSEPTAAPTDVVPPPTNSTLPVQQQESGPSSSTALHEPLLLLDEEAMTRITALLVGMGYTEEDAVAALKATGELGKAMDWISKLSEVTAIEESHDEPAASGAPLQDQNETQGQESPQEKAPPPAESGSIQDEDTHVAAPVAVFPAAPLESNEVQPSPY